MTISIINNFKPGAIALAGKYMAQLIADMNEIQQTDLKLFIGNNDSSGFFAVEAGSNKAALDNANQAAGDQMLQGWAQFGDSEAQALTSLGGVIGGSFAASGDQAQANALAKELNPPPTLKVSAEPVPAGPASAPATDSAILTGANGAGGPNLPPVEEPSATITARNTAAKEAAQTEKTARDEKTKAMEDFRTKASNAKNQYQYLSQMAGNFGSGLFRAWGGYSKQAETIAQGNSTFMQGTRDMINQITGMTNSQISTLQQQAQAAGATLTAIIQLSTRG